MTDIDNHHAYVEDADSEGNPVDDTKTYVSSAPPSVKEEANVSRTRNKDKLGRRDSSPPTTAHHADSDSATPAKSPIKRESRRPKESKDKAKKDEKRKSVTYERPPARSSKTLPNIETTVSSRRSQDQSAYFGVSPNTPSPIVTTAATSSRPRAYTVNSRPPTYYGPSASRPPPASVRYWPHSTLGTSFPPQPSFPPATAPPYQGPYPPPHAFPPLPSYPQPQPDYFSQSPRHRPEYRRPTSVVGRQFPSPVVGYGPDYDDDQGGGGVLLRKPSLKKRPTRQEEERNLMPPPRRPSTSIPTRPSAFAPPSEKRRSIPSITSLGYDDDSVDDESIYSASEQVRHDYRPHAVRRPSIDPTPAYDTEPRYEQPAGRRSRRNSHYGAARTRSTEREVEDKMQSAQRYQARVVGPVDPLTVDSIRRMNKTPSAGGTRSSGYAPTSRASIDAGSEDMRIVVKGTAMLTIGNAQMAVGDGAEIRIPTGAGGEQRTSRGGSDPPSSTYETERAPAAAGAEERGRERRTTRFEHERDRGGGGGARGPGRATSRAGSHSRGGGGLSFLPSPQTGYGGVGYPQHYQQAPVYRYAPPGSHPYPYPTHLHQF